MFWAGAPIGPGAWTTGTEFWRITAAVRVFALALSTGLSLSAGSLNAATVVALGALVAVLSALDVKAAAGAPGVNIAEAVLAAVAVSAFDIVDSPMSLYLAVPPLVAALRHGIVSIANTVMAEVLALIVVMASLGDARSTLTSTRDALTWVGVGLGVGLLTAWLRGPARHAQDELEPYRTAYKLLDQLRVLSRHLPVGLDTVSIAREMVEMVGEHLGTSHVSLFRSADKAGLVPFAGTAPHVDVANLEDEPAVRSAMAGRRLFVAASSSTHREGGRLALPMRVGDRILGVVVADLCGVEPGGLAALQRLVDGYCIRLETAALFQEVRSLATMEERNRLAREIHDGVAQEIASLGYLVDDLGAATGPAGADAAHALRGELSRIVSELRFSIFDLKMDVPQQGGLAQALSDYARDIGARAGLTVHLALGEQGPRLGTDVETELLRIAQEAITNTRKHARASNLWVTWNTNGTVALLRIEDDGVGSTEPKRDHYGLQIMRERADRIGAELAITGRAHGGTSVVVALQPSDNLTEGVGRADLSTAR